MYVCLCTGVTDGDIRAAIADGATTADMVMMQTRAGSRCGSCRSEVAELVRATLAGEPADASARGRVCCREDGKRHLDLHDDRAPLSAA